MEYVVGIDLGTTNTCVAIVEQGVPKVIPNKGGYRTTPSMVAISESGKRLVGHLAKRQVVTNPVNTVYAAKRLIGRKWNSTAGRTVAQTCPYTIVEGPHGDIRLKIREHVYSVPETSAFILAEMKMIAEQYLGGPVEKAVITVPAYFNDNQRQATKDAGRIAGLEVIRIINEPTAAALAYGFGKGKTGGAKEQVIAVYDLGGGTFDISILEVAENVVEVISTNGDTHLGGDDFDDRIVKWLIQEFKKDTGLDIGNDKLVLQRLKDAAEKAKIELSSAPETEVNLPFLTADATGPKHMQIKLSRAKFEGMVEDLVKRSIDPLKKALTDAKKSITEIDEILLVGGSTRIPMVQKAVKDFFGGKEPNRTVNPDEVVAVGAAIQGGVLSGDVTGVLLLDVTPLNLGIETLGSVMTALITANTTIPTRKSETFSTASDNQPSVEVHVCQGERSMASDNRTLGRFSLGGIPPAPRGVPQIEVTFDIDANGIVHVSAKDKATAKESKITITANSGLNEQQIQEMVAQAAKFEAEDKKRREAVESRNSLEALIIQTEKLITENGDKLPQEPKVEVEAAIKEAKDVLESKDTDRINAAKEKLTKASHKLAQAAYGTPGADGQPGGEQGPGGAGPGAGPGPGDKSGAQGDVIDAEFEEKN